MDDKEVVSYQNTFIQSNANQDTDGCQTPLVYNQLELGQAETEMDESCDPDSPAPFTLTRILSYKRTPSVILRGKLLAEEEINAGCMFRTVMRTAVLAVMLLLLGHLLFTPRSHQSPSKPGPGPAQGGSQGLPSDPNMCNGVIIQHPQKFACVYVDNKYEIINKVTGKVSANGNDDKDDDDYNDNNTSN